MVDTKTNKALNELRRAEEAMAIAVAALEAAGEPMMAMRLAGLIRTSEMVRVMAMHAAVSA